MIRLWYENCHGSSNCPPPGLPHGRVPPPPEFPARRSAVAAQSAPARRRLGATDGLSLAPLPALPSSDVSALPSPTSLLKVSKTTPMNRVRRARRWQRTFEFHGRNRLRRSS